MTSPAERYAAARRRQAEQTSPLGRFRTLYDFPLDDFQETAANALTAGRSVLVAAPTGAGKTVVGEFAVHLAIEEERKCFYTTPIKALSNQKYVDLVRRYGPDRVGLLTGDNSINGDAPVVVMTTEVLRNMLYAASPTLLGLGYVVMDEVHYLADRARGAVWEEVIIHLPESVLLACLSATVSNAEEFGQWLCTVRGATEVIVEEHRPVPLWQHVLVDNRLHDLFVQQPGRDSAPARRVVNPELTRLAYAEARASRVTGREHRPRRGHGQVAPDRRDTPGTTALTARTPTRPEVVNRLARVDLLPAIVFVFSRAGTDAAVEACLRADIRLTTDAERARIRAIVDARCAQIPRADLPVLGYVGWRDGLERGVAAHHAGMLPTFKEVVEELFTHGLVKVVFATETLALGINMPARCVVLERLVKWNGQTHAEVTPGEYTQLTGRAGRRGIDVEGHAVVAWTPGMDPQALAGLASTRTYPLRSSFRPSYNMAVNLVNQLGRVRARELLETSFAQFQADRAVVGITRTIAHDEQTLAGYREAMTCHLGDFTDYARMRQALSEREAALAREGTALRQAAAARSLEGLRPGDVITVPSGRAAGTALVLDPGLQGELTSPRPTLLTQRHGVRRLSVADLADPVTVTGHLRLPRAFDPRDPAARRALLARLREVPEVASATSRGRYRRGGGSGGSRGSRGSSGGSGGLDAEVARLRQQVRAHPCHGCPEREDHARWAQRYARLRGETGALTARVARRTDTVARTFDRVVAVLDALGYLSGERVTPAGRRLTRLYGDLDLLTAECLRDGMWEGLGPADLAACASAVVYESRHPDDAEPPRLPSGRVRDVLTATVRLWGTLSALEHDNGLDVLRPPDLGLAWTTHRWADGAALQEVLAESDLTAGDFVRWMRQVIDVLGQVGDAVGEDSPLTRTARAAIDVLRRGVVAYSSVG